MRTVADGEDVRVGPRARGVDDQHAGRGGEAGERRELGPRSDAARQHQQVAREHLAVGADESVEPGLTVIVVALHDALGARVVHHLDAHGARRGGEHASAVLIERPVHGGGGVVRDDHLGARFGGGEGELHAEHSRAEHDDALTRRDRRAHVLGIGEVAQCHDAAGERRGSLIQGGGLRRPRGSVPLRPLEAGQRGHVRPRTGGEHESVVGNPDAIVQAHHAQVAVDADHRRPERESRARVFGDAAVAHVEPVAIGAADGVLGEQHAVVHVVRFGADDGELDSPLAHRGQEPLDQPRPDGAVAHQHHTLRHGSPPRYATMQSLTTRCSTTVRSATPRSPTTRPRRTSRKTDEHRRHARVLRHDDRRGRNVMSRRGHGIRNRLHPNPRALELGHGRGRVDDGLGQAVGASSSA